MITCRKYANIVSFHPLYHQADLEGLMSLVVLDMSQNNIDNISERSVHSVYVCSVEGAQTDFLNYVVILQDFHTYGSLHPFFRAFWHQENLQVF